MTEPTTRGTASSIFYAGLGSLSLQKAIVGTVAVLSALGLLSAGTAALFVERQRIEARVERLLAQEIAEFRELASAGIDPETGGSFTSSERLIEVSMQRNVPDEHETHLGFLPDVTIVPVDGDAVLAQDTRFRQSVQGHTQAAYGQVEVDRHGTVNYAVLPFTQGGKTSRYVAAYFTDREMDELNDTIVSYAVAATLAWGALVLGAACMAGRILRPVHQLRETAARITDSDLTGRIEVRGDDELAGLGRTFNGMLDRLEDAVTTQRRMLDDVGHELRTPITVVRGNLELMDPRDPSDVEAAREIAVDELDRMSGLVEDMLVLAKARLPEFLKTEPTDIGVLVQRTLDKARTLADRHWVIDVAPSMVAIVDPQRLAQALLQFADNAVKVTGPGDTIGFGCSASPRGVQLWVRDTGPGVAPAERQRIFTRWHSGISTAGGGTGLGLAIVSAIAAAHGGSTWVTSAGAAGGAMFIIDVPVGDLAEGEDGEDHEGRPEGEHPHAPQAASIADFFGADERPGANVRSGSAGPAGSAS